MKTSIMSLQGAMRFRELGFISVVGLEIVFIAKYISHDYHLHACFNVLSFVILTNDNRSVNCVVWEEKKMSLVVKQQIINKNKLAIKSNLFGNQIQTSPTREVNFFSALINYK